MVGRVVRRYPADDATIRSWLLFESVLAHPSIVMRRELLAKAGLSYDAGSVHAEDYDLWVRAARHMALANIPEVLLRYRLHPQQVVQKHEAVKLASAKLIRLAQLECLRIRPTNDEFSAPSSIEYMAVSGDTGFHRCQPRMAAQA